MPTVLNFLFRLFLIAAGLIFAASLAVAFMLLLSLWALRSVWAKLTGRPVTPMVLRMRPRDGFAQMYRRAQQSQSRTPRADAFRARAEDVTDVEPK